MAQQAINRLQWLPVEPDQITPSAGHLQQPQAATMQYMKSAAPEITSPCTHPHLNQARTPRRCAYLLMLPSDFATAGSRSQEHQHMSMVGEHL